MPEPATWEFPAVIESARTIAPRNVDGRTFDRFGLAYPIDTLDDLPVGTMTAEELQKYADIVTHAYPDAVFHRSPVPCSEFPVENMNTVSFANMAYVSLHAVDVTTRERARVCLEHLQSKLRDRPAPSAGGAAVESKDSVVIAVGMTRDDLLAAIKMCNGEDIGRGLAIVGPGGEWPVTGVFWSFDEYDTILAVATEDGKVSHLTYWTSRGFGTSKTHRVESERTSNALTLDTATKATRVE